VVARQPGHFLKIRNAEQKTEPSLNSALLIQLKKLEPGRNSVSIFVVYAHLDAV